MALQPGSPREHLIGHHLVALDPHNTRSARRERARFVESEQPCARKFFERARLADQTASPRQPSDAERGRQRSGKAYCTRAGNHEHGETDQQCPIERQPLRPASAVSAPRDRTRGTKMPTTRSARRWVGLRRVSASRTDRQIWAHRVSVPARLLRIKSGPSILMLPAMTGEPTPFGTRRLSPVITASSAWDSPSITVPSRGMRSPGRTRTSEPTPTSRTGRRVSTLPSTTVAHSLSAASRRFEVAGGPGAASRLEIAAYGEQHQNHRGGVKVDVRAALDNGKCRIEIGGTDAEDDERRGRHASINSVTPSLSKEWSAENDQGRRGEHPEK